MTEMRILTVRQPWSEAIIFGGKDVENRNRNVAGSYRGPVAIHTTKRPGSPEEWLQFDKQFPEAMLRMADSVPWSQEEFGAIIGVVDLVDVHQRVSAQSGEAMCQADGRQCSPWAEPGAHHLVLANPRPLAEPIPYKGALGLRRLDQIFARAVLNEAAWSQGGGAS